VFSWASSTAGSSQNQDRRIFTPYFFDKKTFAQSRSQNQLQNQENNLRSRAQKRYKYSAGDMTSLAFS